MICLSAGHSSNGIDYPWRSESSVINFKILLEQHKNNPIRQGINNGYWELSDEIFKRL